MYGSLPFYGGMFTSHFPVSQTTAAQQSQMPASAAAPVAMPIPQLQTQPQQQQAEVQVGVAGNEPAEEAPLEAAEARDKVLRAHYVAAHRVLFHDCSLSCNPDFNFSRHMTRGCRRRTSAAHRGRRNKLEHTITELLHGWMHQMLPIRSRMNAWVKKQQLRVYLWSQQRKWVNPV